jgi:MOSC domain-containing protein YiiM
MQDVAKILSIQVGLSQTYGDPAARDAENKVWTTAFFKLPVAGKVRLRRLGLEGDEQADLRVHGGPDKAVLAYSHDHYPFWRTLLNTPDLPVGAFGENLTVDGVSEKTVCIGDLWRVGEGVVQVSQPRQPCWKLARRWQIPELPKLVVRTGFCGWYLRVIEDGIMEAGMEMELLQRPHPEWTLDRANQALYNRQFSAEAGYELAELSELSAAWREDLLGRLSLRE